MLIVKINNKVMRVNYLILIFLNLNFIYNNFLIINIDFIIENKMFTIINNMIINQIDNTLYKTILLFKHLDFKSSIFQTRSFRRY